MSATPKEEKKDAANPFAGFAAAAGGPLLFGSSTPSTFSFNASTFGSASATGASPAKKDEDDEDGEGEEGGDDEAAAADESHAAQFQAIVSLQPVEVKTMEEDEENLFKSRAKLYVFVKEDEYGGEKRENWWRERGLGDVKIGKNKNTDECRLLMRQEKTLKICLNHRIDPKTNITSTAGSDKSLTFSAIDFADGEPKQEVFAVKFGTAEQATQFREQFEVAKKLNLTVNEKKTGGRAAATPSSPAKPAVAASKTVSSPVKQSAPAPAAPAPVTPAPAASSSAVDSIAGGMNKMSMAGGYSKMSPDQAEAQAAANFACEKIGKGSLVKIASVKSQVVAGMNYKMALHVKHSDGHVYAHVVTVFQPLPHEKKPMSLTEHVQTGQVQ